MNCGLHRDINKVCYMETRQRDSKYLSGFNDCYIFYSGNWKLLDADAAMMFVIRALYGIHAEQGCFPLQRLVPAGKPVYGLS